MSSIEVAASSLAPSVENLQFLWEPIGKQLQTLIRVQAGGALLEVDTVDLGKQAKRQDFAARIAKATGVSVDAIDGELLRVADERGTPETQAAAEPLTDDLAARTKAALDATDPAVIAEAEAMLASPALIKEIGRDLDGIGVAGEDALRLTLYLLGTSRLLTKPLSAIVQGQSSSGKSYIVECVASLFPPEGIVMATQMTPQSLYHAEQGSLSHRWVVAGERSRMNNDDRAEATRALREMLASGRLSKFMPVKVGNEIVTVLIEQQGPIAYVESTTATRVFEEDASRCILLSTDERSAQTKTILRQIARQAKGEVRSERGRIIDRHQALQRLLERREIVIPFAPQIAAAMELFADRCHIRRAYPMVLSFIQASALLHQRQRDTDAEGRLIASPLDYEVTVRLLTAPLDNMIGGSLSEPAKRFLDCLLDAVKRNPHPLPVPFTNDQIRLHLSHLGRSTVGNHLSELEEKGYLEATETPSVGRGRPPKAYQPTHRDLSADGVLPSLEQLFGDIGAGEEQMPEIPETAVSPPF
jgi:DNA-binding transcriptional ArsR family regulator